MSRALRIICSIVIIVLLSFSCAYDEVDPCECVPGPIVEVTDTIFIGGVNELCPYPYEYIDLICNKERFREFRNTWVSYQLHSNHRCNKAQESLFVIDNIHSFQPAIELALDSIRGVEYEVMAAVLNNVNHFAKERTFSPSDTFYIHPLTQSGFYNICDARSGDDRLNSLLTSLSESSHELKSEEFREVGWDITLSKPEDYGRIFRFSRVLVLGNKAMLRFDDAFVNRFGAHGIGCLITLTRDQKGMWHVESFVGISFYGG